MSCLIRDMKLPESNHGSYRLAINGNRFKLLTFYSLNCLFRTAESASRRKVHVLEERGLLFNKR